MSRLIEAESAGVIGRAFGERLRERMSSRDPEAQRAGVPLEDTSAHMQHSNLGATNVETTRRVARGRVAFRLRGNG